MNSLCMVRGWRERLSPVKEALHKVGSLRATISDRVAPTKGRIPISLTCWAVC